jgi:hypothetical protein
LDVVHRFGQPPGGAPNEEMEMRAHQRVGVHLQVAATHAAREKRQEEAKILAALEHRPPRDRSVEDVMPTVRSIGTGRANHLKSLRPRRPFGSAQVALESGNY